MPDMNAEIEVVVLLDRCTGETQVCFQSCRAAGNTASELWWESGTENHYLYHPDEFYAETLRQRRNDGNMVAPNGRNRLAFVGLVWSARAYADSLIVIARSRLQADSRCA